MRAVHENPFEKLLLYTHCVLHTHYKYYDDVVFKNIREYINSLYLC